MDSLGRFISIFIAIIMVIMLPLQYVAQAQIEVINDIAGTRTNQFTNEARGKGHITREMYEGLVNSLAGTGEQYDIEMEVSHPVTGKEVSQNTLGDILPELTLKNTSLSKDGEIHSLSGHVHTDACYAGHRHGESGCTSSSFYTGPEFRIRGVDTSSHSDIYDEYTDGRYYQCADCYNYPLRISLIHSQYGRYIYYPNTEYIKVTQLYLGQDEQLRINDFYYYYFLESTVDPGTGWYPVQINGTTIFRKLNPDYDKYYDLWLHSGYPYPIDRDGLIQAGYNPAYSCYYCLQTGRITKTLTENWSCGLSQDEAPICDRVVTAITPTNPIQTVDKGASIITTATATYLDGHTGMVDCPSNYNPNQIGTQYVTLSYSCLAWNAKYWGTFTTSVTVTVRQTDIPSSLTVTPSTTNVYNGAAEPTYSVRINYENGNSKILSSGYTKAGWSAGYGTKTVTFSYSENGKTVTASVVITVKPNISGLTVTPSSTAIYNGAAEPSYTIKVNYEDGSNKTITSGYTKTGWSSGAGTKTVTFTYTENGKTASASVVITVKPNVTSLTVTPSTTTIYSGSAEPSYTVKVNYENGSNKTITSGYTKTGWSSGVGTKIVTFTYTENGKTASASVVIIVKPNAYGLTVIPSVTTVYNGSEPTYTVTVNYEDGTSNTISTGYAKTGWSAGYGAKTVTFTYTENGKTVTASVVITVKPNVSGLTVTPSTTTMYNGSAEPSYTIKVNYEDGSNKTITSGDTKTGWSAGYGTKTVIFTYTENGKTVTASVVITVKPNVSALTVTPSTSTIYNGDQEPDYMVRLNYEDGTNKVITSGYSKTGWNAGYGARTVKFSYSENGITVTKDVVITVKPNVTGIVVTPSATSIYNGAAEPSYTVKVNYEDGSNKTITSGDTKTGWSSGVGTKTVTFTYTENGKTVTASVVITVKPNVTSLAVTPSTTSMYNGAAEPSYTVKLNYEDGSNKTITTGYTKTGWSSGAGTKTVTFTYTENGKTVTANVVITVKPNVSSLTVTPSTTTVYNGAAEPSYTVKINYEDGTNKVITSGYTKAGWSTGYGTKTVTFTYTENGTTVTASIGITVKPNINSLSVTPDAQNVKRYTSPSFTVKVLYEDGTGKVITSGYTMSAVHTDTLGPQTVIFSYKENNITKSASVTINVIHMTRICPVCGTEYELDDQDRDNGCPVCAHTIERISATPDTVTAEQGNSLAITVEAIFKDGRKEIVYGWTSDFISSILGYQEVTVTYLGKEAAITVYVKSSKIICPTCGRQYELLGDGSDPGCPNCHAEAVSITASPDHVTMEAHEELNITVTATYRDGHKEEVTAWYTDLNTDAPGTFEATVYYQSVSTRITVIIMEEGRITCPYCGLEYSFSDSPRGCPVCHYKVVGIEAYLRDGGTKVPYKSPLNLEIILIFQDTHREVIYNGWTAPGYQPEVLGVQNVTVYYDEFHTTITIEVVKNDRLVTCPNGHEYYLNDDGTDPGCPYCIPQTILEQSVLYFDTTYTNDIISALYTDGIYNLEQGDYLVVSVTQKEESLRSRLTTLFIRTNIFNKREKYVSGGEVKE